MELKRQVDELKADHSHIAKELEESQKDEKELGAFIETRQKELEEWKNEEALKRRSWKPFVWKPPLWSKRKALTRKIFRV